MRRGCTNPSLQFSAAASRPFRRGMGASIMARRTREEVNQGIYDAGTMDRAAREFNRAEMRRLGEREDALDAGAKQAVLERFTREAAQAERNRLADQLEAARNAALAQIRVVRQAAGEREQIQRDLARSIAGIDTDLNEKLKQAFGDRLKFGRRTAEADRAAMEEGLSEVVGQWAKGQALMRERAKEWAQSDEVVAAAEKSLAAFARTTGALSAAGDRPEGASDGWRQIAENAARGADAARAYRVEARAAAIAAMAEGRASAEGPGQLPAAAVQQAAASAAGGGGGIGVGAPRQTSDLADLFAAAIRDHSAPMRAREDVNVTTHREVEELVARSARLERPPAGVVRSEAVRQELAEAAGDRSVRPPAPVSGPAELEWASGPLGALSPEPAPKNGEAEWRRAAEAWIRKATAVERPVVDGAALAVASARDGDGLGATGGPPQGPLADAIRALTAEQQRAFAERSDAIARSMKSPNEAEISGGKPAVLAHEHAPPRSGSDQSNGFAAVAKSLDARQGRVGIGLWPSPSERRPEVGAAGGRGADTLERLIERLMARLEQVDAREERLFEALDRLAGPAQVPLGTSGAGAPAVPPALPARPVGWSGRLSSGE